MLPNTHVHWKSEPLDIEEDADASCFSPENLTEVAMNLLESFRYYQPSSNEDVIALQTDFSSDIIRQETLQRKAVDVGTLIQMMSKGAFYQTQEKKLPLLIQKVKRENPYLDLSEDLSILAFSNDRMIIPLSSKTMVEFDHLTFLDKLRRDSFDSLFNSMQRAIDRISRANPNAFQQWFPYSNVQRYFEETMNSLKQSDPKIIRF
jgi:hypothetical protein